MSYGDIEMRPSPQAPPLRYDIPLLDGSPQLRGKPQEEEHPSALLLEALLLALRLHLVCPSDQRCYA